MNKPLPTAAQSRIRHSRCRIGPVAEGRELVAFQDRGQNSDGTCDQSSPAQAAQQAHAGAAPRAGGAPVREHGGLEAERHFVRPGVRDAAGERENSIQ